ncbi:SCP2 domain-containing protein [Pokkaliibacter sp. CJK22405]|uniref:ubiquinone biosynthesis accessory factor UbiJ n=1 Tax=Pokkaliibacter sp. CJK22405 TaxID=3384615 RepID=UPI0039847859
MLQSLQELIFATAEDRVNAVLQRDPLAQEILAPHTGKCVAIEIQSITTLQVLITSAGLTLMPGDTDTCDLRMKGDSSQFLRMMKDQRPAAASGLIIEGDLGLCEALNTLVQQLDPDWEGWLASYVGDVPAHSFGQWFQSGKRWLSRARGDLHQDVQEYLQEELKVLPNRYQIEDWISDSQALQLRLDRLEARFALQEAAASAK